MAGNTGRHFVTKIKDRRKPKLKMAAGGQPEYEFEEPAEMWIDLVAACHIPDATKRQEQVMFYLNVAKNSHWTEELAQAEALADQDVDWTGQEDLSGGTADTEPYEDGSEFPDDAHSMKE